MAIQVLQKVQTCEDFNEKTMKKRPKKQVCVVPKTSVYFKTTQVGKLTSSQVNHLE